MRMLTTLLHMKRFHKTDSPTIVFFVCVFFVSKGNVLDFISISICLFGYFSFCIYVKHRNVVISQFSQFYQVRLC